MTTNSDKQEKSAHSVGRGEFPFVFMSVSHTRPHWDVPGLGMYVGRKKSPGGGGFSFVYESAGRTVSELTTGMQTPFLHRLKQDV